MKTSQIKPQPRSYIKTYTLCGHNDHDTNAPL
jgi:hypothetical protein